MNKLACIVLFLFVLSIEILAIEDEFYSSDRLIIDGSVGYNFHLSEKPELLNEISSGGLCFQFRISYFFNQKAGISLLSGLNRAYTYSYESHNSNLSYVPIELAYNIAFDKLRIASGFGVHLINSQIDAFDIISTSNYMDFGYFASVSYGLFVGPLRVGPELKFNYLIDLELLSLTPTLSLYCIL